MPYNFTTAFPPSYKEYQDPISIDANILSSQIGKSYFDTTNLEYLGNFIHFPGGPSFDLYNKTFTKNTVTRVMTWSLIEKPERFVLNNPRDVTWVKGYKKTDREAFESNIGFEISAKSSIFSANLKSSLKMSDETTSEYREEKTIKDNVIYLAGYAYITWALNDTLILRKESLTYKTKDQNMQQPILDVTNLSLFDGPPPKTPVVSESSLNTIVTVWHDKLADTDRV